MKLKTKLKALIIGLLAITTIITTLAPAVPVAAATKTKTKYENFTLGRDNIYQTGLCKANETLSGDIIIPSTFEYDGKKYKITAIGDQAFCGNDNITSVEIPDTVKKIDIWAFGNCTKLKKVKLPKKLNSIEGYAFNGCASLKKVHITAKTVGDRAFGNCNKLSTVTFGDNVKKIGECCFQRTAITSINFNKNIEEIDNCALDACESLKTLTIGENVKKLGYSINIGCRKLDTIVIKSTKLTEKNVLSIMEDGEKVRAITARQVKNSSTGKFEVKGITIKVPKSKLDLYKKILVHSDFGEYTFKTI